MFELIAEIVLDLLLGHSSRSNDRSIVGESPMDRQARWFWSAFAVVVGLTLIFVLVSFH